jgi:S1-C subfamily serine protease
VEALVPISRVSPQDLPSGTPKSLIGWKVRVFRRGRLMPSAAVCQLTRMAFNPGNSGGALIDDTGA